MKVTLIRVKLYNLLRDNYNLEVSELQQVGSSQLPWLKSPRSPSSEKLRRARFSEMRETASSIYIVALFTIYLLYVGWQGYDGIDVAKRHIFYLINIVYLIFIIATKAVQHGPRLAPISIPALHTSDTLALSFLLFVWASTIGSSFWPHTIPGLSGNEGAIVVSFYVIVYIMLSRYSRFENAMTLIIGGNLVLFCSICFMQLAGYDSLGLYKEGLSYDSFMTVEHPGQFVGTIGNTDLTALLLSSCLVMLCISAIKGSRRLRAVLFFPIVFCAAILLNIKVSLGYVGVAAGLALSIPITSPKAYRKRVLLLLVVAATTFFMALYFLDYNSTLFHELHQALHGELSDDMGSGRIYIWKNLLGDMSGHWFIGHGADSVIASGVKPFIYFNETTGVSYVSVITDAHNVYLNILYCFGVPATLLFIALIFRAAAFWVIYALDSFNVAVLGAFLCTYCVAAFFCISHYSTALYFWGLLGVFESEVRKCRYGGDGSTICPVKLFG